jgi:hypothetical protein
MSDLNNNGGSYHNLDCGSSLAAQDYDNKCLRCKQIKKVVMLRRKTTDNGCGQSESDAAQAIANKLIAQFRLTRGEIYDRLYAPKIDIAAQLAAQRAAEERKAQARRDAEAELERIRQAEAAERAERDRQWQADMDRRAAQRAARVQTRQRPTQGGYKTYNPAPPRTKHDKSIDDDEVLG